ncbi:hypothetical protein [Maricaulis sp.]|uniref:hypothetical protein n=1 Tax=Maricaulis sp. TaxID=1486257 RepID=UPI003A8D114C
MSFFKPFIGSLAVFVAVLAGSSFWYSGTGQPMNATEIAGYLEAIAAQDQVPGGRLDLDDLRAFMEADDGRPVFTVNRYRFNAIADYPAGSGYSGTGLEAYDRFAAVMVPLMLARGSHPAFGSRVDAEAGNDWDRIVIVRYRSRRDLVDLFATDAFAEGSIHKWASSSAIDRMIVDGRTIPDGRMMITLIAIIAGLGMWIGLTAWRGRRPKDRKNPI